MLNVFVSIQSRLAMLRDERGQTMAEYGVVLAVIAVIVVTALTALSGGITGTLDRVTGCSAGNERRIEIHARETDEGPRMRGLRRTTARANCH